jgi:hypothetical protein
MAGLLAIFAEFEREILKERVRAGLAWAIRYENCIVPDSANLRSLAGSKLVASRCGAF